MNHGAANTAFGNLIIIFTLALSDVGIDELLEMLRKLCLYSPSPNCHTGKEVRSKATRLGRCHGQAPLAPLVCLAASVCATHDSHGGWFGRHWVWLKRVECRVERGRMGTLGLPEDLQITAAPLLGR
jgi:hypothetical protein